MALELADLLLIATNSDLRQSLEFALRAEGHRVTCRSLAGAIAERGNRPDCAVIDHHAVGTDPATTTAFFRDFAPVILLANQVPHPLSPMAFRTVLKPFLGAALSDAVRDALGVRTATT